jgi:ubiquinone/menaquinone biosynthesis C-methylase UbiE
MKVLDIGCGPGFFTIEIAKMLNGSGQVIAADMQEGMLCKVQQKVEGTGLELLIIEQPKVLSSLFFPNFVKRLPP